MPHCVGRNLIQKNGHTHYNSMNSRCWKSMLLDMSTGWVVFSQDIWQAGIFHFHVLSVASIWCNPPLSWLAIPILFCKKRSSFKNNKLNVFLIRFWRHWVLFSQDIWHAGFFLLFSCTYLVQAFGATFLCRGGHTIICKKRSSFLHTTFSESEKQKN